MCPLLIKSNDAVYWQMAAWSLRPFVDPRSPGVKQDYTSGVLKPGRHERTLLVAIIPNATLHYRPIS